MKRHLFISLGIFWGCVVGAWVPFLEYEKYSILTNTMSHLGNFEINRGWWLFTIACIFMALMTIPQIYYIFRRLKLISHTLAKVGSIFLSLGGVFLFLIGIVPDAWLVKLADGLYLRDVHLVISLVLFAVYPIGIGIVGATFRVYAKDPELLQKIKMRHQTGPMFLLFTLLIIGIFTTQWVRISLGIDAFAPTFWSFALWEWIWVFDVQIALSWITHSLPENISQVSNNNKNRSE